MKTKSITFNSSRTYIQPRCCLFPDWNFDDYCSGFVVDQNKGIRSDCSLCYYYHDVSVEVYRDAELKDLLDMVEDGLIKAGF
ncbi:hypothetical protein M0R04_09355 [Candidatus Dojkabacteria bacterium]|jgi:hypothetical protein|nr:hypothetical protein [Candidatus Dojkabacteria bacterium]